MKRHIFVYIPVFLLFLILVGSAHGQMQGQMIERLRQQLERTDQMIERATDAVRTSQTATATQPLENAIKIQTMAWDSFRAGTLEGYQAAALQTRQALELAKKALSNARASQESDDTVQRRLERAGEIVDRAHELLGQTNDNSMKELLANIESNLQRAWEFYRQGQLRAAVKLADQVEIAARKIVDMSGANVQNQANFEQREGLTRERLERARDMLGDCQSKAAQQLVEQANNAYNLAMGMAREGRHAAALQALQNAFKMATRAIEECGGPGTLEQRYERLRSEADRLAEKVEPGDKDAQRLLNTIREQLDLTHRHFDSGDTDGATAALRAAQLTLNQLQKHVGSGNL